MSENLSVVEVLLDQNLSIPLDYEIPAQLQKRVTVGMRVEVPLRGRAAKGTISALKPSSPHQIRPFLRCLDAPPLSVSLWRLAVWMSEYYATPLGKTLRCFTPPNVRREVKPKVTLQLSLATTRMEAAQACTELRRKLPAQAAVLERVLAANAPLLLSELLTELSISRAPVQSLVKKKLIHCNPVASSISLLNAEFFRTTPKVLNPEQAQCLSSIRENLEKGQFGTHLIHGVTGSGKTEIYLQAIQIALDLGKSAILLVPEVALTSQTIERFQARFGIHLAILHHRRSLGERTTAWEGLQRGEIKVAIGARSAIFCPAQNVGLIIVDEEHDSSYKQTGEAPTYHGRSIAVMRGKLEQAVVLLGSATPSVESFHNAQRGKYRFHALSQRASSAELPSVKIIDMRSVFEKAQGFTHFSSELLDAIKERLRRGEQTLLLFNRRGYRRMQVCNNCSYVFRCPHCDLSLTYHRLEKNALCCHLCNYRLSIAQICPSCNTSETLEFRGFGTEHVECSLHALFPEIRTLRMDRDTTQKKGNHDILFQQFRSHKADVLIGTQMIAKGFHFPAVTLVGILNADASLQIPDYRASESSFQLITQVAGRAGRGELKGEVILQTLLPDHPLLQRAAQQNYEEFFKEELEERRQFYFPPFCHLIKVVCSGKNEKEVAFAISKFREQLIQKAPRDAQILPAVLAGHPKVKDLYYWQFLIKTRGILMIAHQLRQIEVPRSVRILIDVDPLSTFF